MGVEVKRHVHLALDRAAIAARGMKAPLRGGGQRRLIEPGVACALRDLGGRHLAVGVDGDEDDRRTLFAGGERFLRIGRLHRFDRLGRDQVRVRVVGARGACDREARREREESERCACASRWAERARSGSIEHKRKLLDRNW